MFTVLIVDDHLGVIEALQTRLEDEGIRVVTATRLADIPPISNDTCDFIIWDGELKPDNTLEAIQSAAAVFTKPMIAASGLHDLQQKQMEAGCTHALDKYEAVNEAIRLSKATQPQSPGLCPLCEAQLLFMDGSNEFYCPEGCII